MIFECGEFTWLTVVTTPLRFASILKEAHSHGQVYLAWESSSVWISQSIPALRCMIQLLAHMKMHASSLYSILRGETRKSRTKRWTIQKPPHSDVEKINEAIAQASLMMVCTKDKDLWILDQS